MYKRKIKFSAWLVLICMIMNLLSYVPISAKETLGISEEITQIQNELEVVPQQIDLSEEDLSEEEIAEIISNKTIHELTAYEYNQVIKHSNVNEEIFENVSALEYSLEDTIAVCKILQNVDMTTEQFAEAVTNFGDLETAISQGKKFANYRYTHSSIGITKDPICVGFFISGKYSGEILKARAMAFLINLPVEQTNNFTEEITEYPDDDTLGYIANLFCTKRDVLDEYITQKQITAEEFSEIVNENIGSVLEETGDAISTYIGGGTGGYYDPATHPLAPFSFDVNGTETINEMTGAVGYQKTFATIPGKNGLNLTIGARYNTADSSPGVISAITGIPNDSSSYSGLKNDFIMTDMIAPIANFAVGWNLNITYINYYTARFDAKYSSINLPDGSVRSIKQNDVGNEDVEEITLDDDYIKIYDERLFKDSSYTDNGVTSMFCVKYKDGKKEYFDEQGKLMKTENRFGDSIIYRYYTTGTEIDHYDQKFNKVEITDTLNQVTTIEKMALETTYDDDGVSINRQPMKITLPDGDEINFSIKGAKHVNTTNGNDHTHIVESITDQEGQKTSFEYIYNDISQFGFLDSFDRAERAFYPLISVTHPTGVKTEYTYEKYLRGRLGPRGNSLQYYRILERKDIYDNNLYNCKTYSYSDYDYSAPYDNTVFFENSDGLITERKYKKHGSTLRKAHKLKEYERVYYLNENDEEVTISKTEYYDYFERTHPTKIVKYLYNTDGSVNICTTENYEYDEYGDCIKYWSPYADGDTDNTEHLRTTAYDSEYHYPIETVYKKDADTTIKEVNTPSEDHKNIISTSTYMNDVLTAQTNYTYGENSAFPSTQTVLRSTTEGDSITTSYEYLNNTFKTKETTAGNSIEYTYDVYGNVLTQKDANQNTTSYEYDDLGRNTRIAYPDSTATTISYELFDTSGNLLNRATQTLQNGTRMEYNFDALGNILTVKDLTSNFVQESYEYDSDGRVTKLTLPSGGYIAYTYDILGRKLTENLYDTSNMLINAKSYEYTDVFDANTSKVVEVMGEEDYVVKTATYTDKYGNAIRTDLGDTGELIKSKRYEFDYLGNQVREIFRTTETGTDEVRYETDVTARENQGTLSVTTDYYDNQTQTSNNMSGQPTMEMDGNGNTKSYTYNNAGLLSVAVAVLNGSTSLTFYEYDGNGNLVKESITSNKPGETRTLRNTYYAYDSMNRVTRQWGDEGGETKYTYDSLGNITQMRTGVTEDNPNGQLTTYEYDTRGRLTKTTDPMGKVVTNTYDNSDNLITTTDKNGAVTTNTYDVAKQLTVSTIAKGDNSISKYYIYTTSGLLNGVGDTEGVLASNEYAIFGYDDAGRLTSETNRLTDAVSRLYTYDNNGNISRTQVRRSSTAVWFDQNYTYNNINQLTKVTDNLANKDVATYTYDGAGNISTKTLANGVTTSYTYNKLNAISSVTNKLGNTTLSSYAYDYYLDGNKEKVTDNNGRVQSFVYDSLGQLKTETDTLNGGTTTNYAYDVYGNRTSMTVTGANPSQTSYVYDTNNRMTRQTKAVGDVQTIADYAYDNNGNMVSKLMSEIAPETEENPTLSIEETETTDVADSLDGAEAIFYTYDLLNHLTNITADNGVNISYAYDIQNKRVGKTVNDAYTRYVWNGDNIVYESGTTEIRYGYGNGLESITNGTTEHYYLKNGHGDITQLADSTGTIAEDYTYDAFGNQLSDEPTVYNPFRYSGEYFDTETGLIYLRARYYDPSIGRFISEDPIKDGVNWYVYCGSDPVNAIDPSGMWGEDVHYSKTLNVITVKGNIYTPEYREIIARACIDTDRGSLGPMPWGDQSYHFDLTSGYEDSRLNHAYENLQYAIDRWNESEEMYQLDLEYAEYIQNPELKEFYLQSALTARENRRYEALEVLGQGLHALQDIYAHSDWGAGGIPGTWKIHPDYFDDTQYDVYKDENGRYYKSNSKGAYNSDRYHNTEQQSIDYILKFKKGIS